MTTLAYTGAVQTYVVPAGTTLLTVECWGGQGGNAGGLGGYAKALVTVTPGETLNVYVGGAGAFTPGSGTSAGGWNGGGAEPNAGGGSGGGGSDVRQGGTALANRVVIGGGGGGNSTNGGTGGEGGGVGGDLGVGGGGGGGSQTAGGAGGVPSSGPNGSAGALGLGGSGSTAFYGAGGGGGYYGGGGGSSGGGGGGSGYIPVSDPDAVMQDGIRAGNGQVVLTPYPAPNAPALLAPPNSSVVDYTAAQTFSWAFSGSGAGDTQTAFDLRYSSNGGSTWTTVSLPTSTQSATIAANTFTAGSYQWQVRTTGKTGLVGPYSASSFFTTAAPPPAPTITAPTAGATVALSTTLTWTTSTQTAYQVRKVADNAGSPDPSTVYFDTGAVTDSAARSETLSFPTNSRYEHLQVRAQYNGLWSPWADVRVHVSYTPPMTPGVTTAADNTAGTITVIWTAPTPTGGAPATASADVWVEGGPEGTIRLATRQAAAGSFVWMTPASGVAYSFQVIAVGTSSATAASAWT